MLVLGIDTSTPACTVVLAEVCAGSVTERARQQVIDPRRCGELLTPLIAAALQDIEREPADLGAVVVGVGPGPYTSLRVGIVTAASLADALSIPAHGMCSLDGCVAPGSQGTVTVVTDARRREVYWARYADGRRVAGPDVTLPATLAADLTAEPGQTPRVTGAGAELYATHFADSLGPDGASYPDPAVLIQRCAAVAGRLESTSGPLVPLYLRRPDATPRSAA